MIIARKCEKEMLCYKIRTSAKCAHVSCFVARLNLPEIQCVACKTDSELCEGAKSVPFFCEKWDIFRRTRHGAGGECQTIASIVFVCVGKYFFVRDAAHPHRQCLVQAEERPSRETHTCCTCWLLPKVRAEGWNPLNLYTSYEIFLIAV